MLILLAELIGAPFVREQHDGVSANVVSQAHSGGQRQGVEVLFVVAHSTIITEPADLPT